MGLDIMCKMSYTTSMANKTTGWQWPTDSQRVQDRSARRIVGTVKDYAEGRINETVYLDTAWGFLKVTGLRSWPNDPWVVTGNSSYMVCSNEPLYSEAR